MNKNTIPTWRVRKTFCQCTERSQSSAINCSHRNIEHLLCDSKSDEMSIVILFDNLDVKLSRCPYGHLDESGHS